MTGSQPHQTVLPASLYQIYGVESGEWSGVSSTKYFEVLRKNVKY